MRYLREARRPRGVQGRGVTTLAKRALWRAPGLPRVRCARARARAAPHLFLARGVIRRVRWFEVYIKVFEVVRVRGAL